MLHAVEIHHMDDFPLFRGKCKERFGYGDFKMAVGEAVASALKPLQTEFDRLSKDKAYVESVYKKGAETANYLSNKTLRKVYKKVGFVAK